MSSLRLFAFLAVCSALTLPDRASALEPSGTTVAVVQSAAAAGAVGRRVLRVQGPVFMGDRIQTGSVGEAQIEFRDDTRLVVGPRSLLTIDSFVFSENNRARQITMLASKGAFRFITGKSRKQAYSIATPTATIGVRGTRFDLAVTGDGETTLALFEGAARICDLAGQCRRVRGGCAVVVAPPGGGILPVRAGPDRAARLAALFPFVVSQARLLPEFQADTSSCRVRAAALPAFDSPDEPRRAESRPERRASDPGRRSDPGSPSDAGSPSDSGSASGGATPSGGGSPSGNGSPGSAPDSASSPEPSPGDPGGGTGEGPGPDPGSGVSVSVAVDTSLGGAVQAGASVAAGLDKEGNPSVGGDVGISVGGVDVGTSVGPGGGDENQTFGVGADVGGVSGKAGVGLGAN